MIITLEMLNSALNENMPLFHAGDIIYEDVYDALFCAALEKKTCRSGKSARMLRITKEQRKTLCLELLSAPNAKHQVKGGYIYYHKCCSFCNEQQQFHISATQIFTNHYDYRDYISRRVHQGIIEDQKEFPYQLWGKLYNYKFGEKFACQSCINRFNQEIALEVKTFLQKEDLFSWYFDEDNKDAWQKLLFVPRPYDPCHPGDAFKIVAIDGSEWLSEGYKKKIIEKEKRKKEEDEHQRQVAEEKNKRQVDEQDERDRVRRSNELFLARKQKVSPTQIYINKFCDKNSKVNIYDQTVQQEALFPKDVEYEVVKKHNCGLYSEYRQTPLWKIISLKIKFNAQNRCEICQSNTNLVTHHVNYDYKGVEFLAMESLQCLCKDCHNKIHTSDNKI